MKHKFTVVASFLTIALLMGAGKYKVSKLGQPDLYVPTLDKDGKTLTVESVVGPGAVPIGGMVAISPAIDSNAWQPPATGEIKDGFMRADGVLITAQHKAQGVKFAVGTTLPNMVAKYPRGNTTSGAVNGSNTVSVSIPAHYHNSFSLTAGGQSLATSYALVSSGPTPRISLYGGGDGSAVIVGKDAWSGGDGTNQPFSINMAHTHGASGVSGTVGNQGGSNGDGSFGGSISPDSGTAGNNEPAYVEVVWVIRVK